MLNRIDVTNPQGSVLVLPLQNEAGLIVEDIMGLDPVKAVLVSSSFAQMDGAQYQSSKREPRNIKLKITLDPDYITEVVSDLRMALYRYFMPKYSVGLKFYTDDLGDVDIRGRVETLETALFSQEPAVDISIICFDPDFLDLEPVIFEGETSEDSTELELTYEGSVETGILLTLNVDRDLTEFTFHHRTPEGNILAMEFVGSLVAGDVLKISTVPGDKGATLTRSGSDSSFLYGVSPQANWIALQPGVNNIYIQAVGAPIPYTIEYIKRYGGL